MSLSSSPESTTASLAVDEIFESIPGELKPAENHTTSDSTRPPAPYDQHLADDLILREVVHCPSIVDDLLHIADTALHHAKEAGKLPPFDEDTPTVTKMTNAGAPVLDKVVDEETLVDVYSDVYAKPSAVLVATLEFGCEWSQSHLIWSHNLRTGFGDDRTAIPAGFLSLGAHLTDTPGVPSDLKTVAEKFPALAVWEFKNIFAGSRDDLMPIVSELPGKMFPWQTCDKAQCKARSAKHRTTGAKRGYDADVPVCGSIPGLRDAINKVLDELSDLGEGPLRKAVYFVQQSWAEGVHHDATFIIIHCGIYEMIGIRDRQNQRLYITGIIEVSKCKYWKLQVGLYIAILRDAVIRTRLLTIRGEPDTWTRSFPKRAEDNSMTLKEKIKYVTDHAFHRESIIFTLPSDTLYMPLWPDILYKRVAPTSNIGNPAQANAKTLQPIKVTLSPVKDILSILGYNVLVGTLEIDGLMLEATSTTSGKIIIKCASGVDNIERLKREHEVYVDLMKANISGVPKVFGLFDTELPYDMANLRFSAMVMEDVGRSLSSNPRSLTKAQRRAFTKILAGIHGAGILHGDISAEHLILHRSSASLVGFSKAKRLADDPKILNVFKEEAGELKKLIEKPLAHAQSEGEGDSSGQGSGQVSAPGSDTCSASFGGQVNRKRAKAS